MGGSLILTSDVSLSIVDRDAPAFELERYKMATRTLLGTPKNMFGIGEREPSNRYPLFATFQRIEMPRNAK